MAELTDLEGLELLHRDLVAQAEQRLPNIDRLWVQLETRLDEFRRLLDKAPRNEQSRKSLDSGMHRYILCGCCSILADLTQRSQEGSRYKTKNTLSTMTLSKGP